MTIDKKRLAAMFRRAARLWRDNASVLGDIDSRFGDGDHGVTMGKIAAAVEAAADAHLEGTDVQDIKAALNALAEAVLNVPGGSAGPLYGTFFEGFAASAPEDGRDVDGPLLKRMLALALSELQDITKAKPGDKTMMDAIVPAVAAAQAAGDSPEEILEAAAYAARAGAEESRNHVSKFGRARSYGEATLGTPDAGALSSALLFQGLFEGLTV